MKTIIRDVIIRRERFVIRKYRSTDAPALAKYFKDPKVIKNVRGVPGRYTLNDAKKFIRKTMREYRANALRQHFVIEMHGQLVGSISITRHGRRAEIGYWLARPYWGQGIMTAVVKSWCRYITKKYNLNELGGKVFTFNLASARVLQKNGFVFVTRVVNALTINGRTFDDYIFQKKVQRRVK